MTIRNRIQRAMSLFNDYIEYIHILKMSLNIVHSTTFSLLSVNVERIKQKYEVGEYSRVQMPILQNSITIRPEKNFDQVIGTSQEDDIFSVKNKSGTGTVIATDCCSTYKDLGAIQRRCNYCRRDFFLAKPFQVIIDIKTDEKGIPIILGIDQCCSPRCAYGLAIEGKDTRTQYYTKSFYERDGDEILPPKPWRLLDINGGPLKSEEWDDKIYKYTLQPSLVYPMKRTYEKAIL